jgi:hypothetical protein
MTRFVRSLGSALFVLSLTTLVLAQAPAKPLLDVRMGLWEVASTPKMDGMPSIDTSKMSAAQQAQIAAITATMVAKPIVTKTCMTPEKLMEVQPAPDQPGTTCQLTVQTNTSKVFASTMTCTGQSPSKTVVRTEAQSQTAFTGTMVSTSTRQGREISVIATMTGKWLSADCGDVK